MAIFVKIVDSGTLNSAAEKLSISQSSVVRALASLEDELGVQLIYRTTRRLTLTEEGRDYCQRCRHILLEIEDAENALTQRQITPSGKIRITAPMTFGRLHLGPIIHEFLNTFPGTEVELLLLDRVVDLIEEGMDIALRIGPLPDSTLIAKPVGSVQFKVCASPNYVKKAGIPLTPAELYDHQCIRLNALKSHSTWAFKEAGEMLKISVAGSFKTNHIEAALDACAQGLGYCQFLSYQVDAMISDGRLISVLDTFESIPSPVNLVYPNSRLLSSRSRHFIDWAAPRLKARLGATLY